MDLRDVLNEDASNARTTQAPPRPSHPPSFDYFPHQHSSQASPTAYPTHPTPPTPHSQRPPQHAFRPLSSSGPSESHWHHSPGHTPSRSLASNQYHFPQHPPQSPAQPHATSLGSRDNLTGVPPGARSFIHHQSPVLNSPSGPPLSASSAQPPALHHSMSRPSPTPTPNSVRDPTPHSIRESPISSQSSSHAPLQHYPSQPNTPLGPPPTFYQRSSTHGFRDPISPHATHQRTLSGASHAGSSMHSTSPPPRSTGVPVVESPQAHARQSSERSGQGRADQTERERSISVSPKTRIPTQLQIMEQKRSGSHDQWRVNTQQLYHGRVQDGREQSAAGSVQTPNTPVVSLGSRGSSREDSRLTQTPLSHLNAPIDGVPGPLIQTVENGLQNASILNDAPSNHRRSLSNMPDTQHPNRQIESIVQSADMPRPHPGSSNTHASPHPSTSLTETAQMNVGAKASNDQLGRLENEQISSHLISQKPPQDVKNQISAGNKRDMSAVTEFLQPPQKRARHDEPPIWALRSHITAHIRDRRSAQGPKQDLRSTRFQSRSVTPLPGKSPANSEVNGTRAPAARPDFEETNDGPLGYWERSITNVEPFNDLTRMVTDFIYSELDRRPDIAVTDVGGNVSPNGQIEIEAKLGTLVDKRENERIRLPIVSAVILGLEARRNIAFESFMTEQQHKTLNDFLNAEVKTSHTRPPVGQRPRVKIHYEHKRERDSFYELTEAGFQSLPPAARSVIESQGTLKRTKVRVTRDQKTGRETTRIVKCRLVDLDIYCPREAFDVRISINLEVGFQGELDDNTKAKFPDRVKDRLSYLHQAYQIDLTQVTDGGSSGEKTHELEVEISSAEVRKQMTFLQEGRDNELERLIKVFLDNVKVLARAVPPPA